MVDVDRKPLVTDYRGHTSLSHGPNSCGPLALETLNILSALAPPPAAAFDGRGRIWFTGQTGIYGRLDPRTGDMKVWPAPEGRGPYGICTTPAGEVWWCSLAGSFIAQVDRRTGESRVVEPPTPNQGARRVWSDSRGRIWVSEWNSGQLSVHDPAAKGAACKSCDPDYKKCMARCFE